MKNGIVTIDRQYGSGGGEVGRKLSELTGFPIYDQELVTLAAERSGLSAEALSGVDEKAANSLLYSLTMGSSSYGGGHAVERVNLPINDRLFVTQTEIIRELAERGDGVIFVGHCADSLLAGRANLLRVFVTASFDARVETVKQRRNLGDAQAKELIIKTDKRRAGYYSYYTGEKWGKADGYDLVISTDRIGQNGAAELILEYLNRMNRDA